MPKCSSILNCTGVERLFAPPGAPGIRIEELNRLSPDFKERGRYQHLHFVDNDRIYHHLLDLNMVLGRAGLIFPGGEVFPNGKSIRGTRWLSYANSARSIATRTRLNGRKWPGRLKSMTSRRYITTSASAANWR